MPALNRAMFVFPGLSETERLQDQPLHAADWSASSRLSQAAIWFQLAKVWLTI